jgi:hypothetical protein
MALKPSEQLARIEILLEPRDDFPRFTAELRTAEETKFSPEQSFTTPDRRRLRRRIRRSHKRAGDCRLRTDTQGVTMTDVLKTWAFTTSA